MQIRRICLLWGHIKKNPFTHIYNFVCYRIYLFYMRMITNDHLNQHFSVKSYPKRNVCQLSLKFAGCFKCFFQSCKSHFVCFSILKYQGTELMLNLCNTPFGILNQCGKRISKFWEKSPCFESRQWGKTAIRRVFI